MKQNKLRFTLILVIWILGACAKAPESQSNECIQPPVAYEFPVGATAIPGHEFRSQEILPPKDWLAESDLPETGRFTESLIARENEIWVLIFDNNLVARYNTKAHTWKSYTTIENIKAVPETLFLSRDGTVWGLGVVPLNLLDYGKDYPLLSRYDEAKDQFEFVKDQTDILHGSLTIANPPNVEEDSSGRLWMMFRGVNYNKLFSFDPKTMRAESYSDALQGPFAIDANDMIWMMRGEQLIRFDPSTDVIEPFDSSIGVYDGLANENINYTIFLYYDKEKHLWIDDRGWVDLSGEGRPLWHTIVRSPVFIDDYASPENQYYWSRPYALYESSNGWYWFTAMGIVRLDPVKGDWCLFTTGTSPVVEDDQHNIWIVVSNKLYKYHLEP
jgi:streptogramin lyase